MGVVLVFVITVQRGAVQPSRTQCGVVSCVANCWCKLLRTRCIQKSTETIPCQWNHDLSYWCIIQFIIDAQLLVQMNEHGWKRKREFNAQQFRSLQQYLLVSCTEKILFKLLTKPYHIDRRMRSDPCTAQYGPGWAAQSVQFLIYSIDVGRLFHLIHSREYAMDEMVQRKGKTML